MKQHKIGLVYSKLPKKNINKGVQKSKYTLKKYFYFQLKHYKLITKIYKI